MPVKLSILTLHMQLTVMTVAESTFLKHSVMNSLQK